MSNWEVVGKAKKASKNGKYHTSAKEQREIKKQFPNVSFVNTKGKPTNMRHGKVSFVNSGSGVITNAASPAKFSHNPRTQNIYIREKVSEQVRRSPSNLLRYKQALNVQAKIRSNSFRGNNEGHRKALEKILIELGYAQNVVNKIILQLNAASPPPVRKLKTAKSATPRKNLKSKRSLRL